MYLPYIALVGAVLIFGFFIFYFMKRNKTLEQAKEDPNKKIAGEYDAIGRNIIVDKQGRESRT
ncbi:hypothetical protein [Oligoflexus tunisiensis]|uniref:hypothetical protein n=1 Tax=Oligoflexus tunisiensis TaxID=708132 RepID=UPI00114D0967|nr:hypothetical protein [Oligoflexus tunisiensis]